MEWWSGEREGERERPNKKKHDATTLTTCARALWAGPSRVYECVRASACARVRKKMSKNK